MMDGIPDSPALPLSSASHTNTVFYDSVILCHPVRTPASIDTQGLPAQLEVQPMLTRPLLPLEGFRHDEIHFVLLTFAIIRNHPTNFLATLAINDLTTFVSLALSHLPLCPSSFVRHWSLYVVACSRHCVRHGLDTSPGWGVFQTFSFSGSKRGS